MTMMRISQDALESGKTYQVVYGRGEQRQAFDSSSVAAMMWSFRVGSSSVGGESKRTGDAMLGLATYDCTLVASRNIKVTSSP